MVLGTQAGSRSTPGCGLCGPLESRQRSNRRTEDVEPIEDSGKSSPLCVGSGNEEGLPRESDPETRSEENYSGRGWQECEEQPRFKQGFCEDREGNYEIVYVQLTSAKAYKASLAFRSGWHSQSAEHVATQNPCGFLSPGPWRHVAL